MWKSCEIIFILALIYCSTLTTADETTSFEYFSEGETVILNCMSAANKTSWSGPPHDSSNCSHEKSDYSIRKQKEDMIVYTSEREINTFIPNKKRLRVVGKDKNGDFDLEISNASLCDQGLYTCSIDPVVGKHPHSKSYILQLKALPTNITINNETEEKTIIGIENQKMKLVCNVESGLPPEKMLWKMDGLILKEGGPRINVYEFYPNRSLHHSNLTCEVMNNVTEKPLTKSIRLDIKYKPEVLISRESLVPLYEGSKKKLCCEIDSNPKVIFVVWYKNSTTQIKNNSSTCLVIEKVTRQDSGNYTCFAGNEIGNGSSTSSLVVLYPPSVSVEYNTSTIHKNNRYVYCKADGVPTNFTFYRLEHKSHFNEHIRYLEVTSNGIAELPYTNESHSYQDTGLYICNASNGISDRRGKLFQLGEAYLVYNGPPVFVADNRNIQYGLIGKPFSIAVNIYSSSDINCCHLNGIGQIASPLRSKVTVKKNITIRISFHGVNITAYGKQLTFRLDRLPSFQRYNVTVCNNFSNASFIVDVKQGGETPKMKNNPTSIIVGCVMFGVTTLVMIMIVVGKKRQQNRALNIEEVSDIVEGISQPVENIMYQSVQQNQSDIEHPSPASTLLPDIGSENTDTLSHSMDETNQSMDIMLNYADVVFQPSSQNAVRIIGLEDRNVYADVDTSLAAALLPETRSETSSSEDDFVYVDGIENFIEKRETND